MLTKATLCDIERYGDFAFDLVLDQTKSGYPTYADGIKTKNDFLKNAKNAVLKDNHDLLLFYYEGKMEGWISYFWISADSYLQLELCCINHQTEQALSELMNHLKTQFSGYSLYFGFSDKNLDAVAFCHANEFECIETAYNNSFFFDHYVLQPEDNHVKKITLENYADFEILHCQVDADMYWTSKKICENIDSWHIFVYYQNNIPIGTIYLTGTTDYWEIFGVDFKNNQYQENVYLGLLISALNDRKRFGTKYLTFFCEENLLPTAQKAGFQFVDQYVCYKRTL